MPGCWLCLTNCGKLSVVTSCLALTALCHKGQQPMRDVAIAEPDPRLRTQFLKTRARQCRYIVSESARDAICCGSPTSGDSSWCTWHRRMVYVPAPVGQKRKANIKSKF
jgi:hypothetical protein